MTNNKTIRFSRDTCESARKGIETMLVMSQDVLEMNLSRMFRGLHAGSAITTQISRCKQKFGLEEKEARSLLARTRATHSRDRNRYFNSYRIGNIGGLCGLVSLTAPPWFVIRA